MEKESSSFIDLLYNDRYQFTCSFTYFEANKHEQEATFQVFFRKHPFDGQYAVYAGLESVRKFIHDFKFTPEHEQFLRKNLPNITNEYYDWIKQDFRNKIRVKAFKEGEIVFSQEPLISYTGPLGFVQILETPILNLLGFASLIATNATRIIRAANNKKCIEFGLRRAQGPNGGLSASVYSYMGGFSGTSNLKASQLYDIPCYGTMSHAFVTSFSSLDEIKDFQLNGVKIKSRAIQIRGQLGLRTHDGELAAFLAFAKSFHNNFTTLIDTYGTLKTGILNTIIVGKALIESGQKNIGIRLDSGDLCELSKNCRSIWNQHVTQARLNILASDDLHQERLIEYEHNGSEIDVYALGTHIATCKKQPALGLVCKLTEINKIPKMKVSSDPEKSTLPGNKVIYRVWEGNSNHASFDVISLEGENLQQGEVQFHNPKKKYQKERHFVAKLEQLNKQLDIFSFSHTLAESKRYVQESVAKLPGQVFYLKEAHRYPVLVTEKFFQMLEGVKKINEIDSKI